MNKKDLTNIILSKHLEANTENITILITYGIGSKEDIEKFVTFDIMQKYGHYIFGKFGSDYYNGLKNKITDQYILNMKNVEELEKIISYDVLANNKEIIIQKFGCKYYETKLLNYSKLPLDI